MRIKDDILFFAHLRWCHNGWASNILIVVDTGYASIHHSKYWMPIYYDTIEDGQNKKSHLLFSMETRHELKEKVKRKYLQYLGVQILKILHYNLEGQQYIENKQLVTWTVPLVETVCKMQYLSWWLGCRYNICIWGPGLYFIKDKNILKFDLGTIIQIY